MERVKTSRATQLTSEEDYKRMLEQENVKRRVWMTLDAAAKQLADYVCQVLFPAMLCSESYWRQQFRSYRSII